MGHADSDGLNTGLREGTVSRITPRFLAYMLRRMAISFTAIRTLEEGPGERAFH